MALIAAFEGRCARAECDQLFEQLDVDGNGKLSQHEINEQLAAIKETTGLVQSARQIFRGADADGEGQVDADEFYAYLVCAPARDTLQPTRAERIADRVQPPDCGAEPEEVTIALVNIARVTIIGRRASSFTIDK